MKRGQIMVSPTHVEVRRSTDLLAIEDPHVAKALNYINSHANEPLQVAEVARAAGLSARHLFDLFMAPLGRSVYKQITLARVGRICWLLENVRVDQQPFGQRRALLAVGRAAVGRTDCSPAPAGGQSVRRSQRAHSPDAGRRPGNVKSDRRK